ncbi:hypothetical protein ACWEGV_27945, partial [Streptomyces sp. NPDC004976]
DQREEARPLDALLPVTKATSGKQTTARGRYDITIAVAMTGRVDGVVAVVDRLTYRIDDTHVRPADQAVLHGVTHDWAHRF